MTATKTNFMSTQHGFRFPNRFELNLPVKFQLPFGAVVDLNNVVYGLCGGMCFTALDYFHRGETPPDWADVKGIDSRLFVYLCQRQLDSMKISTLVKLLDFMMDEEKSLAARLSKTEIPKLKKYLDKGEPVVLALIRVKGLSDPTQNHQVMATGYEYDPDTRHYKIFLYDPNHPTQEPYLSVDMPGSSSGFRISQSTGEWLRGFFIIPYMVQKTAPKFTVKTRSIDFSRELEEPAFHLCWPVDSRRVNQYFGDNPDTYQPFGLPGHEGLDLYALSGANIYACADGEVLEAGEKPGHPYGIQIRLKHSASNKIYQTIYAHLSKVLIKKGQQVKAGDLIGTADNTGNSFGSHLHLTLKIEGELTPGYPAGIVDPWPYLSESTALVTTDEEPDRLTVYTVSALNLRAGPSLDSNIVALLPGGEPLSAAGDSAVLHTKIWQQGEWLQVRTSGGLSGFVAAWLVQDIQQTFPPSDLVVYPFDTANLRSGPGTAFSLLDTLTYDDPLTVLGDADTAADRLGKPGEWLQVQTGAGQRGFVAAWLLHRTGQTAPPAGFVVYPTTTLNIRARPALDANVLTVAFEKDPLIVLGDPVLTKTVVGKAGHWINVRAPGNFSGYAAAWLLQMKGEAHPTASSSIGQLYVIPLEDLNIRAQPATNSPRLDGAFRGEELLVVEADLTAARNKVGRAGQWVHAQKKNGSRGWLAAWLLSVKT